MMRWIWIAMATVAFAVAFKTNSPGTLALSVLIGVIAVFGAVFAIAAGRIEARSQLQVYVPTPKEAALLRARSERQAAARSKAAGRSGIPAGILYGSAIVADEDRSDANGVGDDGGGGDGGGGE